MYLHLISFVFDVCFPDVFGLLKNNAIQPTWGAGRHCYLHLGERSQQLRRDVLLATVSSAEVTPEKTSFKKQTISVNKLGKSAFLWIFEGTRVIQKPTVVKKHSGFAEVFMNKWCGSNCAIFFNRDDPKIRQNFPAWDRETRTPALSIYTLVFYFLFLLLKALWRCVEWPCHCLWILRGKQVLRPTPVFAEGFDPFGEELKKQAMPSLYFIITKHPGTFGISTVWTIWIGPFLENAPINWILGIFYVLQGGYLRYAKHSVLFESVCMRRLQPLFCILTFASCSDVYGVNGALDPYGMVVLWSKHGDHFWTRTITYDTRYMA